MQRRVSVALLVLLTTLAGCGGVRESWNTCAEAAEDVHHGNADALCQRFSERMAEALPCDAVERVLRQTVEVVGAPIGECSWGYTYRIHGFDPLQATAIHKCPFSREALKVTTTVEVTEGGTRISGLWSDSPSLRSHPMLLRFELCREIDTAKNACIGKLDETSWQVPRIAVWNQWQNLRGSDQVSWEWLAPNGEKITEHRYQVEESPPFDYRTWSYIEPAELALVNPYGTWTVKLALNGKELEAFPIEVVR